MMLTRILNAIVAGFFTLGIVGVQAGQLAQDEHFVLVRLQPGQNFSDLARTWLGDAKKAWQLTEINANRKQTAGQVVAIPRYPVNPSSVYADGYRVLPILCYHQFTNEDTAGHALEITARAFEQQMQYLLDNNFLVLTFSDIEKILSEHQPIPDKAVVITVDDGYRSVYDVAWPLLKKYEIPATLFIYTDFIGGGKALSWQQLQAMSDSGLIEVQSHGKSHISLSRQPQDKSARDYADRIQREIDGSDRAFRKHLGASPQYMSYPYGNSSKTASELYQGAGYELAATVTRGDNTVYSDRYLLHRTMIYESHNLSDFAKFVRGYKVKDLR
jgi:peptidoglycan/xylan/chitin deacetylase (PgdA/CDA1 family)